MNFKAVLTNTTRKVGSSTHPHNPFGLSHTSYKQKIKRHHATLPQALWGVCVCDDDRGEPTCTWSTEGHGPGQRSSPQGPLTKQASTPTRFEKTRQPLWLQLTTWVFSSFLFAPTLAVFLLWRGALIHNHSNDQELNYAPVSQFSLDTKI